LPETKCIIKIERCRHNLLQIFAAVIFFHFLEKKMRVKSFRLLGLLSILVLIFLIQNLFAQSDKTESTKINKKRNAVIEIRALKTRAQDSVDSFRPEAEDPTEPRHKNPFSKQARTELIKINKKGDKGIEILYSPQIRIVQELKTCFIAHVIAGEQDLSLSLLMMI
jgi:hypothetical protein